MVAYGFYTFQRRVENEIRTSLDFELLHLELSGHLTYSALRGLRLLPLDNLGELDEKYWLEAKNFLKTYGKQIKIITIGISYRNNLARFMEIFIDIIGFLPNIRCIEFISERYDNDEIDNNDVSVVKRYFSNANQLLFLETIFFDNDSKIYEFYLMFIGKYQVNITTVHVGMWLLKKEFCDYLVRVQDLVISDVYSVVELGKILSYLSCCGNNLLTLYVNCTYKVRARDLFALLDGFGVNTFDAEFDAIEEGDIFDDIRGPKLRISSLISLAVDDTEELCYYDFLSWLPNLRYLTLRRKGLWRASCRVEMSDLCMCLKKALYEVEPLNNILWDSLKKLQVLTIVSDDEADDSYLTKTVYYYRPCNLNI